MSSYELPIEEFDQLLVELYDAAQDSTQWAAPLERMRRLFSANYVTLILKSPSQDDDDDQGLMVSVGDHIEQNGANVRYMPYKHTLTPFANQTPDKVFTVKDLMSEEEWHNSSYRKLWCAPSDVYHVMAVDFSTRSSGCLRLRVTRPQDDGDFSEKEKVQCQSLVKHISRAVSIHNQLDRSESLGSLYSQAIGRLSVATLLIDESGKVLDQNLFARSILQSGDGLKVVGGRLEAFYPSDNRELWRLIKQSFAQAKQKDQETLPEALSITRPSGEVSLGVVIEVIRSHGWAEGSYQPQAVIYIRDAVSKSQANTDVAKKLFGLTPAETALSLQLTNGLSLEEAAEALNIRRNTARAHLRAIFSKTGVRRQTELVRIFLNSVAALGYVDQNA